MSTIERDAAFFSRIKGFSGFALRGKSSITILTSIFVFLISAAFFLADIGEQSIRFSDEATHVRVIQEMIGTGDYLRPTLDGELYLNKPPLKMWITIALTKVIGESNFSFRLIDGLCSAGIVLLAFLFACELFLSVGAGLLTAFTLLTSFGFFYGGRFNTATQDSFVVFANSCAMWCFFIISKRLALGQNSNTSLAWPMFGAGISLACGVLVKSIVGLVPLVILAPVLLFNPAMIARIVRHHKPALLIAIVAAVLPPIVYFSHVLLSFEGAWSRIFGYDIKARLFTEGFHNPEKWWFYLDRLFVQSEFCAGWLLACALVFLLIRLWSELSFNQLFLTSWAFTPLIVFTCLQSRAFHYIGPAFPAFALAITALLMSCFRKVALRNGNKADKLLALCLVIFLMASFFALGQAGIAAVQRLLVNKRKLPIELAINDIRNLASAEISVGYLDFNSFLEGDTYQRWRQQFYLDILNRNRKLFSTGEELLSSISGPSKPEIVFISYSAGLKLLTDKGIRKAVCAAAPLWKPEGRRQSVNPEPSTPQAMVIAFGHCEKYKKANYLFAPDRLIELDEKLAKSLFGVSKKEQILGKSYNTLDENAVLQIERHDLWVDLPTRISLSAALSKAGAKVSPLVATVVVNGQPVGNLKIGGSQFRKYDLEIPAGVWRRSRNLVSIHSSAFSQQAEAVVPALRLSGFKIDWR